MVSDAATRLGSVAYCGAAPSPLTLLSRWNLDPILILGLCSLLAAYLALAHRRASGIARWRQSCFCGGWAVAALALISPLCALSVSLFSARLGQHMLLEMVAAPLIALGWPIAAGHGTGDRDQTLVAAAAFAVTLWYWHAPAAYAATFQGVAVYWLMHVSAFGAALWLWRVVLAPPARHLGGSLAAILFTTLQMGFLGALLTFSVRPLYAVHAYTTAVWGRSPLEDQQLGGIIMWIPTGAIFVTAIVAAVAALLRRAETGPVGMVRS